MEKDETNKHAADSTFAVVDIGLGLIGIPPVASLMGLGVQVITSFRDAILVDNLHAFLSQAKKLKKEETNNFLARLGEDRQSFIKKLISAIDRMNDEKKSAIIGRLFVNTVKEFITVQDFNSLCFQLEKVYIENLPILLSYQGIDNVQERRREKELKNPTAEQNLSSFGLLIIMDKEAQLGINPTEYELTELGRIIIKYGLKD